AGIGPVGVRGVAVAADKEAAGVLVAGLHARRHAGAGVVLQVFLDDALDGGLIELLVVLLLVILLGGGGRTSRRLRVRRDQIASLRRLPRVFEEFAQFLNLLLLRFEAGLHVGEVVGASCAGEGQEPRPHAEQ